MVTESLLARLRRLLRYVFKLNNPVLEPESTWVWIPQVSCTRLILVLVLPVLDLVLLLDLYNIYLSIDMWVASY
jgi:hypothetical protein